MEIMRGQLTSDLFLSGINAITLEGELYNVDGVGNRVAALTFGPKKTVVVAGANKIVRDIVEARARVELVASPPEFKHEVQH
jgi:L-lactate utilization protein LutB